MTRTLQEQLVKKGLSTTNQAKAPKERPQQKVTGFYSKKAIDKERSTRETEELMGVRRPKYHRVKGSYRSR